MTDDELKCLKERAVPFFMDFEGVRSVEAITDHLRIGVASRHYAKFIPRQFEGVQVRVYIRTTYRVGGKP